MKNKLNHEQGYQLILSLFNHWVHKENVLQDLEEWIDSYLTHNGRNIYNEALKWDKGVSGKELNQFSMKMYNNLDRPYLNEFDRFDECPDFTVVHKEILRLVKEVLKDFIHTDNKILDVGLIERKKVISEKLWKCLNCGQENIKGSYRHNTPLNICINCKVKVNIT